MKKVYTAKDIKDLVSPGASLDSIPAGSILTPSAKDAIKEQSGGSATASTNRANNAQSSDRFPPLPPGVPTVPPEPIVPSMEYHWPALPDRLLMKQFLSAGKVFW